MHAELSTERSCRALLVDGAGRVLLSADESPSGTVWAAPGGPAGLGEAPEAVLRRALHAATGLRLADGALRDLAWVQHVPASAAGPHRVGELVHEVYLVRVPHFEPAPHRGLAEVTDRASGAWAEATRAIRWWSPAEMTTAAGRGTLFSPRDLPRRLPELLAAVWDMPVGEPDTIHGY